MKTFKEFMEGVESKFPMISVNGVQRHITNSEGNRIHPTDEGVINFHNWFGNSHAVDEHNRPKVLYRGLNAPYDKNVKKDVTWVTPSKDYSNLYSDSESGSNTIPVYAKIHHPINLGFGSQHTQVQYPEIASRVKTRIMDQYQNGGVGKEGALSAIEHLDSGLKHHGNTYKPVYEWQDKHLHNAVKAANFDAIESKEGDSVSSGGRPEHATYGILDPTHLKSAVSNTGKYDITSHDISEESEDPFKYRGEHRGAHIAPGPKDGASLDDVTANGMYPKDVYSDKGAHYYGSGNYPEDVAVLRKIHAARNKPNKLVSVYRAVPKHADDTIYNGDWVTIHRPYAVQHGKSHLNGYKILHSKELVRHLYTDANALAEFGVDRTEHENI